MNYCMLTDEWKNCVERINYEPKDKDCLKSRMDEILPWASYRGQTLLRTGKVTISLVLYELYMSCYLTLCFTMLVRGMMYYRRALEIQCIQDKILDSMVQLNWTAREQHHPTKRVDPL